ncbi:MAG: molybdopterin converting factor subunit 1 [Pseudomonadota bacterium]
MIDVHYFASVRESLGLAQEQIPANAEINTVLMLMNALVARHGERWDAVLRQSKVLMAVNKTVARTDTVIKDGDEVAFFPPVTGG